jgi:4,4'-diaponeurosporenoate glycosyltransferase
MYPVGFRQLIQGWSKAFVSGAGQTHPTATVLISLWFAGMVSVPIALLHGLLTSAEGVEPGVIVLYLLYAAEHYWMLRRIGSFYISTAVCFPVIVGFFLTVFLYALMNSKRGAGVQWKGRRLEV